MLFTNATFQKPLHCKGVVVGTFFGCTASFFAYTALLLYCDDINIIYGVSFVYLVFASMYVSLIVAYLNKTLFSLTQFVVRIVAVTTVIATAILLPSAQYFATERFGYEIVNDLFTLFVGACSWYLLASCEEIDCSRGRPK